MFKTLILSPPCEISDALWVRDAVFTKEQGFTIPDEDEFDAVADHVIIYRGKDPVATGRVYREAGSVSFHLGRIAVLREFRGFQLGRLVMDELEKLARAQGAKKLTLGAQLYAVPFYEKCGFVATGERFFEEFCEHEELHKDC